MIDGQAADAKPAIEFGEAEIQVLVDHLQEVCHTMLDLNKDMLNLALHREATLALVKNFAENKMSRVLVAAKIDRATDGEQSETPAKEDTASDTVASSQTDGSNIQVVFAEKVEYLGHTAQTIAFLKRESYAVLDLKTPESDIEKMLDTSVSS